MKFAVLSFVAATAVVLSVSSALADGDAAAGATLFRSRCTSCHNAQQGGGNRIGPNLFGVFGRRSASIADYNYSAAMRNSGITWTADKLKPFLTSPRAAVPGTKMTFAGFSKEQDVANVIAYLATLK